MQISIAYNKIFYMMQIIADALSRCIGIFTTGKWRLKMLWPCLKLIVAVVMICFLVFALFKILRGECVIRNCDEEEFEADALTPAPYKDSKS